MGIVDSQIKENALQQDGKRYVTYQYTFTNGDMVHYYSMSKPGDYDVDAGLIAYQIDAEVDVLRQNDGKLIAAIDRGDLSPLDAEPIYPDTMSLADRKKRLVRKLLRLIATADDLKEVRRMFYPVWYWLKFDSGYTGQQIANYLNISIAKLQAVDARFQRLHDHLALIDEDEIIEEVDN